MAELAAASATSVPLDAHRGMEKGNGGSEGWSVGLVASLSTSWTDRWGHGRCTVATAWPCVDDGLWPVGHSTDELNQSCNRGLND
jgi:hypothetical protein